MARGKKSCEIQVAAKKWSVFGNKFNNNNPGEFMLPHPSFISSQHKINQAISWLPPGFNNFSPWSSCIGVVGLPDWAAPYFTACIAVFE